MKIKTKMKMKKDHKDTAQRPRPRHEKRNTKYKMHFSIMMVICVTAYLSGFILFDFPG